jgi:hypothetical protein
MQARVVVSAAIQLVALSPYVDTTDKTCMSTTAEDVRLAFFDAPI